MRGETSVKIEFTAAEKAATNPLLHPLFLKDDGLEIEATVGARMVLEDYGVRGSPRWWSPADYEIEEIVVNGAVFTEASLAAAYSPALVTAVEALIYEMAETAEFDPTY